MKYCLEIDCAPMTPRPSVYAEKLKKEFGIDINTEKPNETFFGNWTWIFLDDREDLEDKIFTRLEEFYAQGSTRYGSIGVFKD